MIFFDLEFDDLDPVKARIIQYAFLMDDGEVVSGLVNPERPIPAEVMELTKITDAMVSANPPFKNIAQNIADLISGEVLVGFGCLRADVPILAEEFERAGVDYTFGPVIDCGNLFKLHCPRNLKAAALFYTGQDMQDAHKADIDASATEDVFEAQRNQFPAIKDMCPRQIAAFSNYGQEWADPHGKLVVIDGKVCFNTFKNKGVPIAHDQGYAHWMLRTDFPLATKRVINKELDRIEREYTEKNPATRLFS